MCQIGNGKKFSFQHINWLVYKIKYFVILLDKLKYLEDNTIQALIQGSVWNTLEKFTTFAPIITDVRLQIIIPLWNDEDTLIWISTTLTFKYAYECHCNDHEKVSWVKTIRKSYIPPTKSLISWRLMHNTTATYGSIKRRGVTLILRYSFYNQDLETPWHIFLNYI